MPDTPAEAPSSSSPSEEVIEKMAAESGEGAASPSPSKDTPYDEQDEKTADEEKGEDEEEEEEEETCGFCIFMKGGGCKQAFTAWSDCVDGEREAGNDFTEQCKDATIRLRECMLAHRDYYAPLLEQEEAEMEAAREAAAAAATAKEENTEAAAPPSSSEPELKTE